MKNVGKNKSVVFIILVSVFLAIATKIPQRLKTEVL